MNCFFFVFGNLCHLNGLAFQNYYTTMFHCIPKKNALCMLWYVIKTIHFKSFIDVLMNILTYLRSMISIFFPF